MKANRLLSTFAFLVIFNAAAAPHAQARARHHAPHVAQTADVQNPRHASIAIEAKTGRVLFESGGRKELYPASTTKIMTAYLVFQALSAGTLKLTDTVPVSRNAALQEPTNLDMTERVRGKDGTFTIRQTVERITVEDALKGMLCHSANDAAVVMAEAVAGTEQDFVARMNETAKKLGMAHTRFINPNGLPGDGQATTVEDMARLANAVMRDYPQYYKYFDIETFSFNGHTYRNTNRLLGRTPGMDGLKTGYIDASGFNLVASVKRGEQRVIAVVFGARTPKLRNAEMNSLIARSFSRLSQPTVMADARTLSLPAFTEDSAAEKPVKLAKADSAARGFTFTALRTAFSGTAPCWHMTWPQNNCGGIGMKMRPLPPFLFAAPPVRDEKKEPVRPRAFIVPEKPRTRPQPHR